MDLRKKTVLSLIVVFLVLFVFMLISVLFNHWTGFDLAVNKSFNEPNNIFISISKFIHYVFDPIAVFAVLFLASGILLYKRHLRKSLLVALSGIFLGLGILIVKNLVGRVRPENALVFQDGFSFPSGHAIASAVLFLVICFLFFKFYKFNNANRSNLIIWIIGFISLIFALFVGFSRLVLNLHWLSDVLAGWFLGGFLFFSAYYLIYKKKLR